MNHIKIFIIAIILGSFCSCIFTQTNPPQQQIGTKPEDKSYPANCEDLPSLLERSGVRLNSGLRSLRLKPFGDKVFPKPYMALDGLRGNPGNPGRPGMKGYKGQPGEDVRVSSVSSGTRCKCVKGKRGSIGTKGANGLPGRDGEKGLPGQIGQVGYRGIAGEPGLPGPPASPLTKQYPNDPGMMYIPFDQYGNLPRVMCHHFRRQVYVPGIPNAWLGWHQTGKSGYFVHNKWLHHMSRFTCPCSVSVPPAPNTMIFRDIP